MSLREPLSAPVRDPLWFLTRQWQLGEFRGEDAASPAYVQVSSRTGEFTSWRTQGGSPHPITAKAPIEPEVEFEPLTHDLGLSVELGQVFEMLLKKDNPAADVKPFRQKFSVRLATDDHSTETRRFLSICAGNALDGVALYLAVKRNDPVLQTPALTIGPTVQGAFVNWVEDVFGPLAERVDEDRDKDPETWDPLRLEYNVAVEATLADGSKAVFSAQPARDGGFDWHTFSLIDRVAPAMPPPNPPATVTVVPTHVRFRGMPNDRWWDFENNITDFGGIDVQRHDLAKLAVMDFMLLHGNDWFIVPYELKVNSICRIDQLVVRDVFGGLTRVERADKGDPGAAVPWSLFSISASVPAMGSVADFFVLPPAAAVAIQTGRVIEDVRFIRDQTANMAWAVEHQTESPTGESLMRSEREHADNPPLGGGGGDPVDYRIETAVPQNWIPFLPVAISANNVTGEIVLQRGEMLRAAPGEVLPAAPGEVLPAAPGEILPAAPAAPIKPKGRILQPSRLAAKEPYQLREEEVPRLGVRVLRVYSRTRWSDGSTHLWIARRKMGGQGEGSSALRFDLTVKD
jgi:hypothetical protein